MFCGVFCFPPSVYVGTLNLIASIPGPCILTLYILYSFVFVCGLTELFFRHVLMQPLILGYDPVLSCLAPRL